LLIFVSVIVFCGLVYAASLWDTRKSNVQNTAKPQEEAETLADNEPALEQDQDMDMADIYESDIEATDLTDPAYITIPEQYGTIIETHKGTNGKTIIHIQDAHMNYEGQKNEAMLIESLLEDYGLNLILLEGKVTDFNFNYIRERASVEERAQKADELLKDGVINGVNYVNIATDYPMNIQGIEDKKIYDDNRDGLWEIDKFKGLAAEYVDKMTAASDAIKSGIYNNALLDLDTKKKEYDAEKIDLLGYYEYLYGKAEETSIPLYTFPNFQSLINANNLEKKIDLAKIRDGSASDEEMDTYSEYLEATRELNINELFKEEPLLEDVVQNALATTYDQKKLLKISKALSVMGNLLKIKVVPEEYNYFMENKKDFDAQFWSDFLEQKSRELGISADIPSNYYVVNDNLAKVANFYSIAAERDKVFLEKTNEHIQKAGAETAILVAGGFHTPTLTDLLADAGYSYIVISPKVTTETNDELYRSALKKDWMPGVE